MLPIIIEIESETLTVYEPLNIPNAGRLLFCYGLPEGADKLKKEYLSGFDCENPEYRIAVADIVNYDVDKKLADGTTFRDLLGPHWAEFIEDLAHHSEHTCLVREMKPIREEDQHV